MKRMTALILYVCALVTVLNAQNISPYLFGQNHWLANGDEGRVG